MSSSFPGSPGIDFTLAGVRVRVTRVRSEPRRASATLPALLFGLTLALYLVTHFWGLDRFPIYFFSDEAVQTNLAADLVHSGFHNDAGTFLPTFFKNADKYNLGLSVYLQVLPYLAFGKSVWVTRGVPALLSILAVVAVCLILKDIFKRRFWWIGGLFLMVTPAWFLHSRTAFETGLMVTFYALFLYFYLRYRSGSPKYLYWAVTCGALAFYSYAPGQVIAGASGLLLLIADFRYHWQQRRTGLKALALLLLLALPFTRFQIESPAETARNLAVLGSFAVQPGDFFGKLGAYAANYLSGFNPLYWYFSNPPELVRHVMKGYGQLSLASLPFTLIGMGLAVRGWRSPAYRALGVVLLAAPAGEALVGVGITRLLVMVLPAAVLAGLGASWLLERLERHWLSGQFLAWAAFLSLGAASLLMLADALQNGPLWYPDYGLYGMQWGGKQLFSAVAEYRQAHPEAPIMISSCWANNTDALEHFFLKDTANVQMGSIDTYLSAYQPIPAGSLFVLTAGELDRAEQSGKFTGIQVLKTIPYPDGQPGFDFVSLAYVPDAPAVFAAEAQARKALVEEDIIVAGLPVRVRHSRLDMGTIREAFDGNPQTVIRTLEANPLVLDLVFAAPRTFKAVVVRVGAPAAQIRVTASTPGGGQPETFSTTVPHSPDNRDVQVDLGGSVQASELRIEVESVEDGVPAHVHVWEVKLE
jgi:4-amino-4-deoxy-L-arabinose transferase-like glycosyltransferase